MILGVCEGWLFSSYSDTIWVDGLFIVTLAFLMDHGWYSFGRRWHNGTTNLAMSLHYALYLNINIIIIDKVVILVLVSIEERDRRGIFSG